MLLVVRVAFENALRPIRAPDFLGLLPVFDQGQSVTILAIRFHVSDEGWTLLRRSGMWMISRIGFNYRNIRLHFRVRGTDRKSSNRIKGRIISGLEYIAEKVAKKEVEWHSQMG